MLVFFLCDKTGPILRRVLPFFLVRDSKPPFFRTNCRNTVIRLCFFVPDGCVDLRLSFVFFFFLFLLLLLLRKG